MNRKILFELLYAKNFKKTLFYMRRYEAYMRNGISYDKLHQMMEYDYKVYLETKLKKDNIDMKSKYAISKLEELSNITTNITSTDDAICKFKALKFAYSKLNEE